MTSRASNEPEPSPHARIAPVPLPAVGIAEDSFLGERIRAGRAAIPTLFGRLEEHGVVDNFRRLATGEGERRGFWFSDSDLYKAMEAAALSLESHDDPALRERLDRIAAAVVAAQAPDGYLHTQFEKERYQDISWTHELYCAGHFIEAAIAHRRATGDNRFFSAALRLADHLSAEFGPGMREQADGHPEIELALTALYRATGKDRYLDLARFFLGRVDHRAMPRLTGHAVRALYYGCGLTDLVLETGDASARESLDRFWTSLVETGSYVTGGVGGRWVGESIGRPYELPNEGAYAETCGAAAAVMWSGRMLALTGDARYTDFAERALYNGFLAGVSLAGDEWFYVNRLAWNGRAEVDPWGIGPMVFTAELMNSARRKPWYDVTCCPSNAVRLLASLPALVYGWSAAGVWVHLYAASTLRWRTPAGRPLVLTQETRYPWEGTASIGIGVEEPEEFSVFVRVPGWSRSPSVYVNGDETGGTVAGAYLEIRRVWSSGDELAIEWDDRPFYVESHPRIAENRGSLAIQRGPIVYCLEGIDNGDVDLFDVAVDPRERLAWSDRPDLLGGVTVVTARGRILGATNGPLYARAGDRTLTERPVGLTAIPYYAWANRDPAPMTVWIRRDPTG